MAHLTAEEQLRLHGWVLPATCADLIDSSAQLENVQRALEEMTTGHPALFYDDLFDDLRAALTGNPKGKALIKRIDAHVAALTKLGDALDDLVWKDSDER